MISSRDSEPATTVADSTVVGITVLCLFSVAWTVVLLPLSSASTLVALIAVGISILWAGCLALVCHRRSFSDADAATASDLSSSQRQRIFVVTNVAQAVVFSVAISVCIATARIELIPLIAALVVGAHFIPLAWAFNETAFRWAGAVLAALGGSGLVLTTIGATTPEESVTITAVGASVTLLTAASVLLQRHGHRKTI